MREFKTELSTAETFVNQLTAIARRTALAEMASGMAHEMNQPLAAIATFAHAGERMLNRADPLVERALDVFRQVSQEALSAGERLQGIRHLFKREHAIRTRCQIYALIAELQPTLNRLANYNDVLVLVDTTTLVPDVQVDRLNIQSVVLSLVQNAIEACANVAGSRVVRIDVSADRYTVELGITDSGAGVPPGNAEHLFRPFFTTKLNGTGLGLASSRAIIELHEGTMGFNNIEQGGARFWLRLPVAVE